MPKVDSVQGGHCLRRLLPKRPNAVESIFSFLLALVNRPVHMVHERAGSTKYLVLSMRIYIFGG